MSTNHAMTLFSSQLKDFHTRFVPSVHVVAVSLPYCTPVHHVQELMPHPVTVSFSISRCSYYLFCCLCSQLLFKGSFYFRMASNEYSLASLQIQMNSLATHLPTSLLCVIIAMKLRMTLTQCWTDTEHAHSSFLVNCNNCSTHVLSATLSYV